jgi:type I restriction enzyme S subunit
VELKPGYLCPPGYKQTEVGVIPKEWDVSTVGREFEIKLGKMLDAEKNVGVPKPYLGNKAVQWDRIDISDLPTVPMSRADIKRFRLQKGDLLACEGGEVGRAAIWDAPIEECYYQKALHRLRPLRGFDSRLMVALLRQWSDRGLLANYVTQTSIAHLPCEKFVEVPMPVPPPPEQRAIAGVLSDVDELIGALDQLIAKKRNLKQATMQQLLTGQTRLPGFGGKWEMKKIGELLKYERPDKYFVKSDDYQDSAKTPVLTANKSFVLGHTNEDFGIYDDLPAIIFDDFTTDSKFVEFRFKIKSSAIKILKARSAEANLKFVYERMRLINFPLGEHKRHYISEFQIIEIPTPKPVEQTAITEVLSDMDSELAALEQRRDKTHALKQGMMQELLTGRTRLV